MREKLKKEKEEVRGLPSFPVRVHNGPLTRARFPELPLATTARSQGEEGSGREGAEGGASRLTGGVSFTLRSAHWWRWLLGPVPPALALGPGLSKYAGADTVFTERGSRSERGTVTRRTFSPLMTVSLTLRVARAEGRKGGERGMG